MQETKISVKEFLSTIAAPRGMTINDIEVQLKGELECNQDFRISVGKEGTLYAIPLASIREYFEAKIDRPKEVATIDEASIEKMMDFDPAAKIERPAKPDPRPPAPPDTTATAAPRPKGDLQKDVK